MTVETQPEGEENAHSSDAKMVRMSGQKEEIYAHNDVLPIAKKSHGHCDVNLLPGGEKGPSPEGLTGRVAHEATEICPTVGARGLGIPSRNLIHGSPKLGDQPSGRKASSSPT